MNVLPFAGLASGEKAQYLHRCMGHVGVELINRTIDYRAATGLPDRHIELDCLCKVCETSKGRMGRIPKKSETKFLPGEAVAMDSQGSFRTRAFDGSNSNIKIVDMASGFIGYIAVAHRTSKALSQI